MKGLNELKAKYKQIGDVRGAGLMIGVEMVKNRDENLDPMDPNMFGDIYEKTKD